MDGHVVVLDMFCIGRVDWIGWLGVLHFQKAKASIHLHYCTASWLVYESLGLARLPAQTCVVLYDR